MQEELLLEILNVVKRSEAENKKAIEELRASFDGLEEKVDRLETRFNSLEARFDGLEEKVDRLETRFDGLEEKVDRLETRFDSLEVRFDGLEEKVDSLETKSDRIDAKTDRIEKRITDEMEDTSHMIKTLFNQTDRITNYLDLNWNMKKIN